MGRQTKAKRNAKKHALARQGYKCHLCGKHLTNGEATADHIVPKSKGGKQQGNIAAAHAKCNRLRGNKSVEQYKKELADAAKNAD